MFFFSSRRRHTRFDCDWSSDVCSSDLCRRGRRRGGRRAGRTDRSPDRRRARARTPATRGSSCRSEERRVGKECRSRWSPDHEKKKKKKNKQKRRRRKMKTRSEGIEKG